MRSRNTVFQRAAAVLILLAFATTVAPPDVAARNSDTSESEAVRIDGFEVRAPDGLHVGGGLTFTVRGTPQGAATVLVTGIPETIYLEETSKSVYSGNLSVHPHMQFFPQDFARVTLEKAGAKRERGSETAGRLTIFVCGSPPCKWTGKKRLIPEPERRRERVYAE